MDARNTAPQYPHGTPESPQERQDLLDRLNRERYPHAHRTPQDPPRHPKPRPLGWETGPIPPNGGYTRPTEPC